MANSFTYAETEPQSESDQTQSCSGNFTVYSEPGSTCITSKGYVFMLYKRDGDRVEIKEFDGKTQRIWTSSLGDNYIANNYPYKSDLESLDPVKNAYSACREYEPLDGESEFRVPSFGMFLAAARTGIQEVLPASFVHETYFTDYWPDNYTVSLFSISVKGYNAYSGINARNFLRCVSSTRIE